MPRGGNYGPAGTTPAGIFRRVCPACRQEFRTDHPHQRYCSERCKRKMQNARAYRRRKAKTKGEQQ
jgi:hypothetical protein